METSQYSFEQLRIARLLLRWIVLVLPVAVAVGVMVAFFLWLLGLATNLRHAQMWLIYLLPLGGVGIVWLYRRFGKNSEAGNNLIMDEIHTPGGGIPFRMAPLVLLTTVLTHLFGGSAGREGTAVQMGGSTAEYFAQKLGLGKEDKRILLMAGMAAGFGAVFGTPVTGAIFALEVLAVGRIKYDALLPCLFASLIADITCNSLAVHHTHYAIGYSAREAMEHFGGIDFDLILLLKVLLASACFGLASFFFCGAEPWAESTLAGFPQTLVVAAGAGRRVGLGHQLLSGYLGLSGTRGLFVAGRRCLHRQRLRSRRGDVLQLVLEATLNRHHPEFRLQGGR